MKIVFDNGGQTCNVFWSYLAPICKAVETGERYISLTFDKELHHYPVLRNNSFISFPLYSVLLEKIFGSKYRGLINKLFLCSPEQKEHLCEKRPNLFVNGWVLRHIAISEDKLEIIKQLFVPEKGIIDDVQVQLDQNRKHCDLIVGVHIRRGDYQFWQDGKYYYSIDDYIRLCKTLSSNYFSGKTLSFLFCSNETIQPGSDAGFSYFSINNGSPAHDLYALSQCDYIIGPPSSFSRFAAFIGDVPICFILSKERDSFNFRRLVNYSTYSTGEQVEFDF